MTRSERSVDIDRTRASDAFAQQQLRADSCVAAFDVWACRYPCRYPNDAAAADGGTRTGSIGKAISKMRLWAIEVPSQ
jgi:hypothetical protein